MRPWRMVNDMRHTETGDFPSCALGMDGEDTNGFRDTKPYGTPSP